MAQALHRHRITITIAFGALLVAAAVLATSAAGDDQPESKHKVRDPATNMSMALELRDNFVEDVAKELNEDPDRVQGAVRNVVGDWVERYRGLGVLSGAQADVLLDCWDGKDCRLPGLAVP